ncbi:MAG: GC-type dockerin domain-anchored protein [Planctomycetota bacterium]
MRRLIISILLGLCAPTAAAEQTCAHGHPAEFCGVRQDSPVPAPPSSWWAGRSRPVDPGAHTRLSTAGPCTETGQFLDILIVYTPAMLTGAGGLTEVEALADKAYDELYDALNFSGIANGGAVIFPRIVGLEEVEYTESGFLSTDLSRLREPGDGFMDGVHDMRNSLRADLVCLWTNFGDVCGIANIAVQMGESPRPDLAFSVVSRPCLDGDSFVMSHEIGHNLGLVHQIESEPCLLLGSRPDGRGYVEPGGAFRTIMATAGANRINRYSNHRFGEGGLPRGEFGVAVATDTLSASVVVASRFRDRDQDGDGVCDDEQIINDPTLDCNGNGILDMFDADLDLDGVPDDCQIVDDPSADLDFDGVPDSVEIPVLRVDIDAKPGGLGGSWADAIDDLQRALMIARASGDVNEIWIAEGVYTPGIYRADQFRLIGGVGWYGGFNGTETSREQRDPAAHVTVLSGDLNGDDADTETGAFGNTSDNTASVVYGFGEEGLCILDGLTITGGANVEGQGCGNNGPGRGTGGGIMTLFCDVEIRNCVFERNAASRGGGGFFPDITSWRIVGTDFINNRVVGVSTSASAAGAYLSGSGAPAELINSRFLGNVSDGSSSGMFLIGGSPRVSNVLFSGNRCVGGSDTIYVRLSEDATLNNLTVLNNTCDGNVVSAGVKLSFDATVRMANSIIWGNSTRTAMGSPRVDQFTQYAAWLDDPTTTLTDTIVQGWTGSYAGSNIDTADPLFIDALGLDGVAGTRDDNPRLSKGSPAIDTGVNSFVEPEVATDLDGNTRVVGATVDKGAYEVQSTPCTPDVTTDGANLGDPGFGEPDGVVTVSDLTFFVEAWLAGNPAVADVTTEGTNPGEPGFGTPDGSITVTDLTFLVEAWLAGCP